MKASKLSGLHVITDGVLRPDRSHAEIAKAAIAGGAAVVQFRDKSMSPRRMLEEASEIQALCRAAGVVFLVNDAVDVALGIDADGVHLGQGDMPCRQARQLLGREKIIGISAGNAEEAAAAERDGADYVGYGPIFATGSKPDAPEAVGIESVTRIRAVCSLPIVAIGGIGASNIAEVAEAGADAVAVISAVVCAEDMTAATRLLVERFGRNRKKADS